MQIQQTSPAAPTGRLASAIVGDASAASVDFQSFLRLLTAQLRNQDPLSPLDSTQFVAQLANFSTVEQLVSANARLDRLAESLGDADLDSFASWIGRIAEIQDAPVRFSGAPVPFRIEPRPGALEVQLIGRSESGAEVFRTEIRNSEVVQQWDGQGGQEGELYALEVAYIFADGSASAGRVSTFDAIEAVRSTEDGAVFSLSSGLSAPRSSIVGLGR